MTILLEVIKAAFFIMLGVFVTLLSFSFLISKSF